MTSRAGAGLRLKSALSSPLRRLLGARGPPPPWDDGAPIRAELFSVERLEEHARSLAAAQAVMRRRGEGRLTGEDGLPTTRPCCWPPIAMSPKAIDAGAAITPAAEWLIDNFHVVEKQIREIRADLPPGYYRQLPKLAGGPFAGYPRVFGVAWAFVAHTDSLFDPEVLRRYLRAYQEVQPLTIGELWAVAITLRIVLVENLRRIAKRVIDSRAGRRAADALADRLLGTGGRVAEPAEAVLLAASTDDVPGQFSRAAGPSVARSGSQHRAGVGVARRATGPAGDDRRRRRPRRAPEAGRRQRHGAQHHHQHAPHLRRRLDGAVRARQPGR